MPGTGGWPFRTSWLTARSGRGDVDRLLPHFLGGTALTGALRDFYFGASGYATITVVDVATSNGTGPSINVAIPAGMQQNDVLVYIRTADNNAFPAIPSGFTTIGSSGGALENSIVWDFAYEVQGATPRSSLTVTYADTYFQSLFVLIALRGVDTTTPLDATMTKATGATGMPDSPSITSVTNGAFHMAVGFLDDQRAAAGVTAPSGYTLRAAVQDNVNAPGTNDGSNIMVATKTLAVAGADDPAIFGGTETDTWVAVTAAFRPALSAGGTATLTLAATEATDAAAFAVTVGTDISLSLAATEAADTAALALTATHALALAATEATDTASMTLTARHTASMAATEPTDTAALAVNVGNDISLTLAATEAQDAAAFTLTARHTAALAATETTDTAAMAVTAVSSTVTLTLAATEAQDVAAFTLNNPDAVTVRRGEDGGGAGARERFWAAKAEEWLEERLEQVPQIARRPKRARRRFIEAFLTQAEAMDLPRVDALADMMAGLVAPQPDYTDLAAAMMEYLARARRERRKWRDERDIRALMALGEL